MRYNGGKSRLARRIADAILVDLFFQNARHIDKCLEPFMGGCGVTGELAQHFRYYTANDYHKDLVVLFQALQDGWEPPSELTEEEYEALKLDAKANPDAATPLRTFAGYACSWGGIWFNSYAKDGVDDEGREFNYVQQGRRSLLRDIKKMKHVKFEHGDYRRFSPAPDTVVYCDPPYADTTGYKAIGSFDNDLFWQTMEEWVKNGARVYVSEFKAPDHWETVININRKRMLNSANVTDVDDGLFTLRP